MSKKTNTPADTKDNRFVYDKIKDVAASLLNDGIPADAVAFCLETTASLVRKQADDLSHFILTIAPIVTKARRDGVPQHLIERTLSDAAARRA
jgi:hypothetical protein